MKELGLAVEIKFDYFMNKSDRTVASAHEIETAMKKVMEHEGENRRRIKDTSRWSKLTLNERWFLRPRTFLWIS